MNGLTSENFISCLSHEIRTPLNGIVGYSQLLTRTALTSNQKFYIDSINNCSLQLVELLNDILDFSKLTTGRLTINKSFFNIDDIITNIRSVLDIKINEKGQSIDFIKEGNIPEFIVSDKQKLIQILINLVSNSNKFTQIGGRIVVVFSFEKDLVISVEDNGIGIPLEEQKNLFTPFFRCKNHNKSGYGLGLSITKGLVNFLGGDISVESEKDHGTVFRFNIKVEDADLYQKYLEENCVTLRDKYVLIVHEDLEKRLLLGEIFFEYNMRPIVCSSKKEGEKMISYKKYPFSVIITSYTLGYIDCEIPIIGLSDEENVNDKKFKTVLCGSINKLSILNSVIEILKKEDEGILLLNKNNDNVIKILIAEDVSYNLDMLVKMLDSIGYKNVDTCSDGLQAIEKIKNNKYNILLLDLKMPIKDGFEVASFIRENNIKISIAAVSASTTDDDKDRCKRLGIDYFIVKPYNINHIRRVISELSKS